MNHSELLMNAGHMLQNHARTFGPEEMCYDKIAKIASMILSKDVSPYDVAMIEVAISLGRIQTDRANPEHYVSVVKNMSFSGQFAGAEAARADEDSDIAAMARKFAPKRMPNVNMHPGVDQAALLESVTMAEGKEQEEPKNA